MVGVMPEYQSHNIGFALYQAQADWAKNNQIRFIRWTYDPMETRNANLYIRKLGGRVVQFIPDYYGSGVGSTLQKGLPTDRFLVELESHSECCENSPLGDDDLILVSPQCIPLRFDKVTLEDCRAAQIRVPLNFQELKTRDFQRALEWQNAVRTACSALLDDDAIWVSGFHVNQEASLGIYVVTKKGDAKK
jgi:predicted GNAT superfamily acetyltransferase